MILSIVKEPAPILHQVCRPVEQFNGFLDYLVDNMVETGRANNGIGFSAPQIGLDLQIFITLVNNVRQVFVNPKIILGKKKILSIEGCLSIPNFTKSISRSKRVTVTYQNLNGETKKLKAFGLLARVVQHEYDHLQGVLISDR